MIIYENFRTLAPFKQNMSINNINKKSHKTLKQFWGELFRKVLLTFLDFYGSKKHA